MIILPIKRQNFTNGIPEKSFLFIKSLFAFVVSLVISVILINNEAILFDLVR